MAGAHASSNKRTNCLDVLANESLCHCPCHNNYSHEHENPKRPKQRRLKSPAQPTPPAGSIENHPSNLQENSFDPHSQTNIDLILYDVELPVFPPITSGSSQRFLTFDSQHFPQQDVGAPNSIFETPASCTATDDTLSPRSFSLNRATAVDTVGVATQSPDNANELPFGGPNDFNELQPNWQWVPFNGSPPPFGGTDEFDVPLIPNLITDLNNDPNAISFSGQFIENQPARGGSPFASAAIYGLIANPYNPPWFLPQALNDVEDVNLNGGLLDQRRMYTEMSQEIVSQTPKLIAPQPSKRSSTTSSTLAWSNNTVGEKSVQPLIVSKPELKLPPRLGVRNGPLNEKNAEHARLMRKHKSCLACRLVKARCSTSNPCGRCAKIFEKQPLLSIPSPSAHILCYRGPLANYTEAFFPESVTSRLSETAVMAVIRDNVQFTDNKLDIEMSSGPDYPPLCFTATEFYPLKPEFLAYEYVAPNYTTIDGPHAFSMSYAPPVGLHGITHAELKEICLNHIVSVISQERSIGEVNYGDISMISWEAFEAVNRYRRAKPRSGSSAPLTEAVMLHAMHYFMSRIITITESSAERAIRRLRRPHLLPFEQASQVLTSTLINLQVKQAMQSLLRKTTRTVLKGLEKELLIMSKTKDSWADNFCVVLILCMCIEAVQVSSDSYAMATLRRDPSSKISRLKICRDLDDEPFSQLTDLFRKAYKTTRARVNSKSSLGFNPIRHGLPVNPGEGITPEMRILVNEIKYIIACHGDEMTEAVKSLSFDDPNHDLLTHHMAFRKRNSGRLVSMFLMSFMQ